MTSEPELQMTRHFDVPPSLLFKAWTDPAHAVRWWGPKGFTGVSCRIDARIGGRFRICMRSPDGTIYCKQGEFRDIVEPERLVFTFAWEGADGELAHEMLLTIRLQEQGSGTLLTLHQTRFANEAARDDHRTGWTSTLQRLADYLAGIETT